MIIKGISTYRNIKLFLGTAPLSRRLKKTAIPSIFQWIDPASPADIARASRARTRGVKRKLIENDTTENQSQGTVYFQDNIDVAEEIVIESSSTKNDTGDNSREDQKFYLNVETQTPTLPPMCIDNFEKDDAGIHFYTGLETYVKFYMVLRTLGPAAYCLNYIYHKVTNISVSDQSIFPCSYQTA